MRWCLLAWSALLAAFLAVPQAAHASHGEPLRSQCHATGSLSDPVAAIVADKSRWRCDGGEPSMVPDRALLRFDSTTGFDARFFGTRTQRFDALTLAVVREGRVVGEKRFAANDLVADVHGNLLLIPLPAHRAGDAIVAAFGGPTSRGLFGDARLHETDPTTGHTGMISLLLAAMVCGMLLMPLAFNAAYFRILRERFVLWHLAVSLGLFSQCLLTSGIVGHIVAMPLTVYAELVILTFGMSVAAAFGFCAALIEPRKLHPRLRLGLYVAAGQVLVVTLLHIAFPDVLRGVQKQIYYASFAPVLLLFAAVMVDAWRRGSRAVRYQLAGWSLFLVMGLIRIATMLIPALVQSEAMGLFYVAMVVQSIATSLAVADRVMNIRRQRDKAMSRAQSLEHLSERDDLTGLYNRRALDGRLGDFSEQRFTGFALFDLDSFKRVNDTHGHAVGDDVLRTVAGVLAGHDGSVAVRLGGEEFLLLLRGGQVAERVERLREAIPVRIAREVAELELLVTASGGLVEAAPGGDIGTDFAALYRKADDLLYEAKHNGRNLLAAIRLEDGEQLTTPVVAAA